MKYEIMYIEEKSGVASLEANIGKVFLSKTGKTLEYKGRKFQSLKGNDALYKTKVLVDEEIREEYWVNVRNLPELKNQTSFVSTGKHQSGGKEPKSWRVNI